jgi:threonine dehydrogenase-like Zn-dependent dehydrogenase
MIGSPGRQEAATRAGATAFVDYHAEDVRTPALASCPDGFDFVIDAVGKAALADLGLQLLKAGGTIGIYGMDEAADIRLNPGAARGTFTVNKNHYDEAETHNAVIEALQAQKLDASIWLDLEHPFALADINDAFEAVRSRQAIKALVRLS